MYKIDKNDNSINDIDVQEILVDLAQGPTQSIRPRLNKITLM